MIPADFNLLNIQTCHEWALTIIDDDDLVVILRDKRGSYRHISFYEHFPELENIVKAFVLENVSKKECSFDVKILAQFVDQKFKELYGHYLEGIEFDSNNLVRSEESCRTDLLKWGARWDKNKIRPYFEGYIREDVISKRKEFDNYFTKNHIY